MRIAVLGAVALSLTNFRGPMLKAMVERGHDVIALAPEDPPEVVAQLAAMGVRFRVAPLQRTGMNPIRDLLSLLALRKIFLELKPDILLSYTHKPAIWGSLAGRLAGVPKRFPMITGQGSAFLGRGLSGRLLAFLVKNLFRCALRGSAGVFFQNPDDQALFETERLLPRDCNIIRINGSGVDLDYFPQRPLQNEPPTFLMVARLIRDKGVFEYAEAARQIKARYPQVRCHLLGAMDSNPSALTKSDLEKLVSDGAVTYLGSTDDVRPFLEAAHVYVLPSYSEGTPRSVLEAMATGRAIITTDAPGCRETVVNGQTGFLVPVRDPDQLAQAMTRFLEEPSLMLTMGNASRALAVSKYDVHKVNRVILDALGL